MCFHKYSFNKVEEKKNQEQVEILSLQVLKILEDLIGIFSWEALTHSHNFRYTLQAPDIQMDDPGFLSDLRPIYPLPTKCSHLSLTGISNLACPK